VSTFSANLGDLPLCTTVKLNIFILNLVYTFSAKQRTYQ
jgi:hypothetical protein